MFKTLATAAVLSLAALGANAASVTFSALPDTAFLNYEAITEGTVYQNVTGSAGDRRSPWLDAPAAETGVDPNAPTAYYTSVSANASATFDFGKLFGSLTFVWGSPDTYNIVEFLVDGLVVDSLQLTGSENVAPGAFGTTSALATFTNIKGGGFNGIRLLSPGANAFEVANVAAVPLPAGGLLLIGAIGGLAALRRRKALAA